MASAAPISSRTILVAIPTRNRPAMLAEALASVVAQDDPDWVAVVGDDGDAKPAGLTGPSVLSQDPRVHVARSTTRSPGGARNAAVVFGEERLFLPAGVEPGLVAFLDDDDLWRPDHLAAARAALAAAPEAAFAHGATVTRAADGSESSYHVRDEREGRGADAMRGPLFSALLRRNFVATSSVVVRADALRAVGRFREDLRHGEDWDLWLRLSARGPAAFVDATTVVYRDHGGNVSRRQAEKAADHATVLHSWWVRRHLLAPAAQRLLGRELRRRRRRAARKASE